MLNIEPRDLFSFERQMETLLIFSKKIFEKNYKKGEKKRQTTNGTKAFQIGKNKQMNPNKNHYFLLGGTIQIDVSACFYFY